MGMAAMAAPLLAFAQANDTWTNAPHRWQLNMGEGVTAQSMNAYSAHMLALWICIGIGVLVFGAMAVAMFKFRHSKGAVPDKDFELWAIQGGNNPISMGVVPVGERHAVSISPEVMAGWGEGSVLAITLEEKGGSPDGNPHGPVVAKGAVTPI